MKRRIGWLALAVTAAVSVPGRAQDYRPAPQPPPYETTEQPADQSADQSRTDKQKEAERVIESWPRNTRTAAHNLIGKYGAPDGTADQRLTWTGKGPWSQITLFREGETDNFPTTHQNVVENTIPYDVPQDKAGEVVKFDSALTVDRMEGTLSARSDSEAANILALNLADEIIRGKRDVTSARVFMRDTLRKTMAGKSSKYTDGLLFPVASSK
jgi:hypothetical protein